MRGMRKRYRDICVAKLWIFLLLVLLVETSAAADIPQPPCATVPVPSYPASIGSPVVQTQTVTDWLPPPCLGWNGLRPDLIVALAARLREPGGAAALLARFGAVSRLRGMRYWSVTDQAWRVLVTDATPVTDAAGTQPRGDFSPDEMLPGALLYSAERDSRSSGAVIYRMQVIERSPDRIVVSIVNVSAMRLFLVPLFAPGALQVTYFLDRLGPAEWGFFGLWGVTTGLLTSGHEASSINRAVALYRHFAEVAGDDDVGAGR